MVGACLYHNGLPSLYWPINVKAARFYLLTLSLLGVAAWFWYSKVETVNQENLSHHVEGSVEWLGTPSAQRWRRGEWLFARNVWDLHTWQGRIYLAHGNYANRGESPAPNAGPVPVWYYDTQKEHWINEGEVWEEEIGHYDVLDEQLFIAGVDARAPDDWQLGNYYRQTATGWEKYRNIPNAIHVLDLHAFKDKWFAALGVNDYQGAVAVSDDQGQSWQLQRFGFLRIYKLFEFKHELYAASILRQGSLNEKLAKRYPKHADKLGEMLFKYRSGSFIPVNFQFDDWLPNWPSKNAKFHRLTSHQQGLVFIVTQPHHDFRLARTGLFRRLGKLSQAISLPKDDWPQDMVKNNGFLYVLGIRLCEEAVCRWPYRMAVYRSRDLESWEQVSSFQANTFARSMAISGGHIYFGMGAELKKAKRWYGWQFPPLTGALLRSRELLTELTFAK